MMTESGLVWRISIRVPAEARLAVEEVLETRCIALASFEIDEGVNWSLEGYTLMLPDRQAFEMDISQALNGFECNVKSSLDFELLPQRDWLSANLETFSPIRVHRYFIVSSHLQTGVPAGVVRLTIDPGTAFGSGEHPTTIGCLTILDQLAKVQKFRKPLDMGCGSGILALAMAKTWRRPVVASDIDPEAVRVARINARKNGIAPLVRAINGPGFQSQFFYKARFYDLIVANILARPLVAMAAALDKHLKGKYVGGATVILSGFLERDTRWVVTAYMARGLRLRRVLILDGWATVVLSR